MQKSINNLNDQIKKLEEWRAQFCNQTETNNTEPAPLIDLTTLSLSPSKRVRVSTSSSSESDNKNSPSVVNTSNKSPITIINEQSAVIKDQQEQLNNCMAEIQRLAALINQ